MTDVFLLVLAAAWLVVLAPAAFRARRHAPLFTSETWRRRMQLIAPPRRHSSGRWVVAPPSSGAADRSARRALARKQQRRKRLLLVLVLLVPASLAAALLRGGELWNLHVASYGAVTVYVAFLVEDRRRRQESLSNLPSLAGRRRRRAGVERGYAERRA